MSSSETAGEPVKLQCRIQRAVDPCAIILFGASGDLTAKKLMPALFGLFINHYLPESFYVLGCARSALSDETFRANIEKACQQVSDNLEKITAFLKRVHYLSISYDEQSSYESISDKLAELDLHHRVSGNRLFYLAVPPKLYTTIADRLGQAGLSKEKADSSWTRIIVEKPFGSSLKTARQLDACLKQSFKEEQIYRIDHYLAKETVQNILFFRFANIMFEPLWNSQYIDYVDILASETIGIDNRAGYYEQAGIVRDMFQNHMMQLLSLIAMEPPARFNAEMIRNEKAKLFESLRPLDVNDPDTGLVLGQYGHAAASGEPVAAYREEAGVDHMSFTPTFASFKLFVDNHRWKGVPFYMRAGKRLDTKLTRIIVQFRELNHSIFNNVVCGDLTANRLTFYIQPSEKITLSFETKNPGSSLCAGTRNMEFIPEGKADYLEAYEKVILDCLNGEQMLFLRQDAEELCWSYFDNLINECDTCFDLKNKLVFYPAGSSPDMIK